MKTHSEDHHPGKLRMAFSEGQLEDQFDIKVMGNFGSILGWGLNK